MVYSRVEVMDLEGELALEYVQSYQRERAAMVAAVFADIHAFHKAQVDLKDIAAGFTGGQVGASAHPLDKSLTDLPVKVGD